MTAETPQSQLESWLDTQVQEAARLRVLEPESAAYTGPDGSPDPRLLIVSLSAVRARLDRIEAILAVLIRAKARAGRAAKVARYTADDAWNEASVAGRTGRRQEYVGAKEHYADIGLATLSEQRQARAAERLSDYAAECLDVVRLIHRGLDSSRQDLNVIMRTLAFESYLERSGPADKGY